MTVPSGCLPRKRVTGEYKVHSEDHVSLVVHNET